MTGSDKVKVERKSRRQEKKSITHFHHLGTMQHPLSLIHIQEIDARRIMGEVNLNDP